MKSIHIANSGKRDAEVAVDVQVHRKTTRVVLNDGTTKLNVKLLKTTTAYDTNVLIETTGGLEELAEQIIHNDPDIDMETMGKMLYHTHKLYVDNNYNIVYMVNFQQVVINPDGTERLRRDLNKAPGNINSEIPVRWTGKMIKKEEAARKFIFTRKYQIRHINGATFDFLYNMAKELHKKNSLVLLGAGSKGNGPLILTRGGEPYRGFLEGRVDGEKYALILHLTNIEMKGLEHEGI